MPASTAQRLVMADGASGERRSDRAAAQAADACAGALAALGSPPIDLLMVFVSPHHGGALAEVSAAVTSRLKPATVIGCAAEVVIAGALEMEGLPGISLLALSAPGMRVHPFTSTDLPLALQAGEADDGDEDLARVASAAGIGPGHRATILLADPFTQPTDTLLHALARARAMASPGSAEERRAPIVGGLASGSARPGTGALLLNGQVTRSGLVGVSLSGALRVDSVVSQGCRPFGPNFVVTAARGRSIRSLSGRPALAVLQETIESLSEAERQALSRGVMLGRVINEHKDRFGRGDYLMRAVSGVNEAEGEVLVADRLRVGQTVRFHVRDAQTASEDLEMLLDAQTIHGAPAGCLLVTCNGRGTRLFSDPSHDARHVQTAFVEPAAEEKARGGRPLAPGNPIPLAGFFAAGEIGPVGDGVFLHGQTACAVMFRPASG